MPFNTDDEVWYACYGSNLDRQRLMCYIQGGMPRGGTVANPGCIDPTPPKRDAHRMINRRLYFARQAESWQGGGVTFVETEPDAAGSLTHSRLYLITRQQFEHIFDQENDRDPTASLNASTNVPTNAPLSAHRNASTSSAAATAIDFAALDRTGILDTAGGWYRRLLFLGEHDRRPIYTFTAADRQPNRPPSDAYLQTIIRGLRQTCPSLTPAAVAAYLIDVIPFHTAVAQANRLVELASRETDD